MLCERFIGSGLSSKQNYTLLRSTLLFRLSNPAPLEWLSTTTTFSLDYNLLRASVRSRMSLTSCSLRLWMSSS